MASWFACRAMPVPWSRLVMAVMGKPPSFGAAAPAGRPHPIVHRRMWEHFPYRAADEAKTAIIRTGFAENSENRRIVRKSRKCGEKIDPKNACSTVEASR